MEDGGMKNIAIHSFAVLLSLTLTIITEQYLQRLWVWTTPSGNREIYHGPLSDLSLILVLVIVAIAVYKLTILVIKRIESR